MAGDFVGSFYQSRLWLKCRASYIAKRRAIDGGMCEVCKEVPGYIVHHKVHITPYNITDQDVTLSHSNLQFVCHHCHDVIHGNCPRDVDGMERLQFGPDGQPTPL